MLKPPPAFCTTHCAPLGAFGVTSTHVGGSWYIDMSWVMYPVQPESAVHSAAHASCVNAHLPFPAELLSSQITFWTRGPPALVQ
jgi:hypothetical protein